jgi:ribosomal-protein-alanine N-acetyltransferase
MPRAHWTSGFPRLQSNTVALREITADDEPFMVSMFKNPRVRRYLAQPPTTRDAFRRYLRWSAANRAAGRYGGFAILYRGRPAGMIFFWITAPGTAEIGFALHPRVWGTPVFRTAARLLAQFAFRTARLRRLEMRVAVENTRAQVAIHKLGARPEALLRDAFMLRGRCCDAVLFRLLKREFQSSSTPMARRRR